MFHSNFQNYMCGNKLTVLIPNTFAGFLLHTEAIGFLKTANEARNGWYEFSRNGMLM